MANRKNQPWKAKQDATRSPSDTWAASLPAEYRTMAEVPSQMNVDSMGSVQVLVTVQNADLADLSNRIYNELSSKIQVAGGSMPISQDDLLKYFATALYARVAWVNRQERGGRLSFRPTDRWALPVPMSIVVAAIGKVESQRGTTYVPVWNESGNDLVLEKSEWERISNQLRSVEDYGFRFVKALERADEGVERIMSMFIVDEPEDRVFYGHIPPTALDCLVALYAGLSRVQPVEMPSEPDLVPRYKLRGSWVVHWRHDFAAPSSHRDVV